MATLCFSDVLLKAGLNPARVKLIRHALTDKGFKACYNKNMVLEYTRQQKKILVKTMITGVCLSVIREPKPSSTPATK